MKILILTCHFSPNVGGVETHLNDLVEALKSRGQNITVLSYQPLITKAAWKFYEKGNGIEIFRLPWPAGLFYKLVKNPVLEFIYLTPGIFLITPFVLLFKAPAVIHSHGLIAGSIAVFWGKMFGIRVVTTTHSIYHFPASGMYRRFANWVFNSSDEVLTLSKQSASEIISLGAEKDKVRVFTYWVDLKKFKVQNSKLKVKKKLGWEKKFVVLFVGRLVPEKGIFELLESLKIWNKNIFLAIAGTGPIEGLVKKAANINKNLIFLGKIDNKKLPDYYNGADVLVVPSVHEEGFGRVIIESLACGVPVIGARRGAIPEAMNGRVGKLIKVTPTNIKNAVEGFYKNKTNLKKLSQVAVSFAKSRYSEKNVETIIQSYR